MQHLILNHKEALPEITEQIAKYRKTQQPESDSDIMLTEFISILNKLDSQQLLKIIKKSLLMILNKPKEANHANLGQGKKQMLDLKKDEAGHPKKGKKDSLQTLSKDEIKVIRKFIEVISKYSKLTTVANIDRTLQMLKFLNEMGLDSTSAGYLGEEMHQTKKQAVSQVAGKKKKTDEKAPELMLDLKSNVSAKALVKKLHQNVMQHFRFLIA